jgi:adenylate kinase family enzyme
MEKILIIGCPGSGKSTLSKKINKITKIPLYHLDLIYWKEDKTNIDKNEFISVLSDILKKDEWIIDGNYSSTMEMRIKSCDTIIFLDYPLDVCLKGVNERKGTKRSDMPWIETEDDISFIEFIKEYNSVNRPQVLALFNKYPEKKIYIFKNRKEADEFVERLKRKA